MIASSIFLQGNKQALKDSKLAVAWFLFLCDKATSYIIKFYENCKPLLVLNIICAWYLLLHIPAFSPLHMERMRSVVIGIYR